MTRTTMASWASKPWIYIVGGTVVLLAANRWMTHNPPSHSVAHVASVRTLVDQANAWHALATSKGNVSSSSRRLVYASRAAAYLSSARSTIPDADLERATGVDIADLVNQLESTELKLMRITDGSAETVPAWLGLGRSI